MMRLVFVLVATSILASPVSAYARPAHRQPTHHHATAKRATLGQCRDHAGRTIACGPSASTNAEAVPLNAVASVTPAGAAESNAAPNAPADAVARCHDGTFAMKGATDACLDHGGVSIQLR